MKVTIPFGRDIITALTSVRGRQACSSAQGCDNGRVKEVEAMIIVRLVWLHDGRVMNVSLPIEMYSLYQIHPYVK